MGFDPEKVPVIREAFRITRYSLTSRGRPPEEVLATYNGRVLSLRDLSTEVVYTYASPRGWRGRIEMATQRAPRGRVS